MLNKAMRETLDQLNSLSRKSASMSSSQPLSPLLFLQEFDNNLASHFHCLLDPIQERCTMTGCKLLDDPRLLGGGYHTELRLPWHNTVLGGDYKRQVPPEGLVCPGWMRLRGSEWEGCVWFEICDQGLGLGQIDICSEVIDRIICNIEIRRGL
jgi:hypothetical protein